MRLTIFAAGTVFFRSLRVDTGLEFRALMLMFCRFETFLAPVDCIANVDVIGALLTSEDSFRQVEQTLMASCTLHEGLCDELVAVLGWTLAQWDFLLLESMRVRRILFIALNAESEVFAVRAIEPEHLLWNWIHAFITAVP